MQDVGRKQKKRDAGKEGFIKGGRHEGGIQERRVSGKEEFRKGGMQKGRAAAKEGVWKVGMQERSQEKK